MTFASNKRTQLDEALRIAQADMDRWQPPVDPIEARAYHLGLLLWVISRTAADRRSELDLLLIDSLLPAIAVKQTAGSDAAYEDHVRQIATQPLVEATHLGYLLGRATQALRPEPAPFDILDREYLRTLLQETP